MFIIETKGWSGWNKMSKGEGLRNVRSIEVSDHIRPCKRG